MKMLLFSLLLCFNLYAKDITLTDKNTVSLLGPVDANSVTEVMFNLQRLSAEGDAGDPIYLVLNTPGGSVSDGLDLVQYMNQLRRPVHVVANFAASMGFQILQNSPVRYITKYGTIMSHQASGGFRGNIPGQVMSRFNHINQILNIMDEQVVQRTGGKYTLAEYKEMIRDEYWSVGTNAIDDKFADEIATLKCDESLNNFSIRKVVFFIFSFEVKVSNCPLITEPIVDQKFEDKSEEIMRYFKELRKLGE